MPSSLLCEHMQAARQTCVLRNPLMSTSIKALSRLLMSSMQYSLRCHASFLLNSNTALASPQGQHEADLIFQHFLLCSLFRPAQTKASPELCGRGFLNSPSKGSSARGYPGHVWWHVNEACQHTHITPHFQGSYMQRLLAFRYASAAT